MPTFTRQDQEQFEKAQDLLEGAAPGQVGFVKSLFFGRLRLDQITPYPVQDAIEAQRTDDLLRTIEPILSELNPDEVDARQEVPRAIIDRLAAAGVLGMTVPVQYGGGGFSHTAYCRVLERISARCASTAVVVGAHQSIGLKALVLMGNEQQKLQFLPDLAAGRKLAAFCLSEPEVGSDAANVQTTARRSEDGSHFILNGTKRYATNAAIAGMMTVMAKSRIGSNGTSRDKVSAFIVTPDLPGFNIVSHNRDKCGVRGSWQATLQFNDMKVPADRVLGEFGRGLKVALSVLDYGRCTLSAGCVGGAKAALALATEHVRNRRQFGRSISEFGLVKQKLARMAETTFAMDAITYLCAGMVDRHEPDLMLETAMAKLFCSEGLWQIADDTLQLWGGEGYMREHGIERMLRDARINRIVEGTTEVMTAFVALVGMKGVGEELENVMRLARHPLGNFGRLAQFAHQQWDDVVIGPAHPHLADELTAEGHALARLTHQFARHILKVLRIHRQSIIEKQLLQQRLSWAAIDLFAMGAVISKLQMQLTTAPASLQLQRDLLIGKSFCRHACERINQHLHTLFVNTDDQIIAVADAVLAMGSPSAVHATDGTG